GQANGLAFTPDHRQLYLTDTLQRAIYRFDYDADAGTIRNRRVFARVAQTDGLPDGLTVDAEACIWSARWGGGCLVRYLPDGRVDRRLPMPARKVTSLTFGGDSLMDIYVTTAGGDDREANGPAAGALLRLRLGIRGLPEFVSRVLL
ncbi:MAG: SMP-30/gluconolactonase/LRE family protein, partial [Dehalococcoidales bacterium]|nr:SMP-30/gluconolactonase/LRE family protein [Dehalococcoidales bacterium]